MQLEGSCHCGAVHFSCESEAPYPFMRCYCSICRKTGGGGGYAVNLHADANTLAVTGEDAIRVYCAWLDHPRRTRKSTGERRFCGHCGTALWVWDSRWPELMHPFASAVDTPLPTPPQNTHILLDSKAEWVAPCVHENDLSFGGYPDESLVDWHKRHGLLER